MRLIPAVTALGALLLAGSCGPGAPDQPATAASDSAPASSAAPGGAPAQAASAAPAPVPPPLDSHDPRRVVVAWAKAVSLRHWDEAYGYWGDHGARSGLTLGEFRAEWGKLKSPVLEIGEGRAEGGAGSLYYNAPVTLIDGERRIRGEVVMRKVNNVPGATPEQLRWHLERTTITP